jgi:hypothetical protein
MVTLRDRVDEVAARTSPLAWAGFAVTLGFCGLAAFIVAGYTVTDPGGWFGVGVTALWLVPMIALAALALYRPDTAVWALALAAILPLGFGIWTLVDYVAARDWEDKTGPVSLVFIVAVAIPLAVEGLSRPTLAGLLLVGVMVVPLVLAVLGAGSEWGQALSIGIVASPVLLGGVLYLFAGRASARPTASV